MSNFGALLEGLTTVRGVFRSHVLRLFLSIEEC